MDINEEKTSLRKLIRQRQQELDGSYCKRADDRICEYIISLSAYEKAQTIFCFVGTADEIDTTKLLADAWQKGKRLLVPKCAKKGIMYAYAISSKEDLEEGQYGILEPKPHCTLIPPTEIDFGVIPCMSCDTKGYRLGHGGGYYDRYLEGQSFKRAVICREALLLEEIPVEAFDLQMDWVVTEERVVAVEK